MSTHSVQVQGHPMVAPKTVFYTGTGTIEPGYLVAYDNAAALDKTKEGLGSAVKQFATADANYIAGVVTDRQPNKVGPQFIEVYPLGSVDNDVVEGVLAGTGGVTAGQWVIGVDGEWGMASTGTKPDTPIGIAAETALAGARFTMWTR